MPNAYTPSLRNNLSDRERRELPRNRPSWFVEPSWKREG